ncbi:MAG TPA: ABC transporter permease [Candidatus Polarisedimenticolaceae bacterium]|nr:ABC transporter permease [Candidatus Polarisedimenticolaceae bacterium]
MKKRGARLGVVVLAAFCLAAAAAPLLPLRDPAAQPDGLVLRSLAPGTRVPAVRLRSGELRYAHEVRALPDGTRSLRRGESWTTIAAADLDPAHPDARPLFFLGTDAYGRDLASRLVWGARVSLAAGILAAAMAVLLGGAVGLAAGLGGPIVDEALMRLTDAALAVPRLFLLVLLAALFRPSLATIVVLIGLTTWMPAARLVRAEAKAVRAREFVLSARALGASPLAIALRHVLPHATAVLGVEAALRLGQSVLLEASLSFLGLGVPPPLASWGSLIADGRDRILDAWWIATWPGLAIVLVVVAASLIADGVRESF